MPNDISRSRKEKDQRSDQPQTRDASPSRSRHDFAVDPRTYQHARHEQQHGAERQASFEAEWNRKGKAITSDTGKDLLRGRAIGEDGKSIPKSIELSDGSTFKGPLPGGMWRGDEASTSGGSGLGGDDQMAKMMEMMQNTINEMKEIKSQNLDLSNQLKKYNQKQHEQERTIQDLNSKLKQALREKKSSRK